MTGDWKEGITGDVYVEVNDKGTLEKLSRPKWYRVILLYIYNAFRKKKSYSEVKKYLTGGLDESK